MNLRAIYQQIQQKIDTICFSQLWQGFERSKFALYSNSEVCFEGKIQPKTEQFVGNTAINYNGENVAIWQVNEPFDADILTSKIVHEMFHAHQHNAQNLVWPNEIEATIRYCYSPQNLSIKHRENMLLSQLALKFDKLTFDEFCALRKYRLMYHNYEMHYEMDVEMIEGTANYVELQALKQLSQQKYQQKLDAMLANMQNPKRLFPMRILCYDVGTLLLMVAKDNGMVNCPDLNNGHFLNSLIADACIAQCVNVDAKILQIANEYCVQTRAMINAAINQNDQIDAQNAFVVGYNVYNARYMDGYLLTTHFLLCKNNQKEFALYGDFVVETEEDLRIKNIFKTQLGL